MSEHLLRMSTLSKSGQPTLAGKVTSEGKVRELLLLKRRLRRVVNFFLETLAEGL
jgi:hypothetical protein